MNGVDASPPRSLALAHANLALLPITQRGVVIVTTAGEYRRRATPDNTLEWSLAGGPSRVPTSLQNLREGAPSRRLLPGWGFPEVTKLVRAGRCDRLSPGRFDLDPLLPAGGPGKAFRLVNDLEGWWPIIARGWQLWVLGERPGPGQAF